MSVHWPLIVISSILIIVLIFLIALLRRKKTRNLTPLARTFRLSELPGYQRSLRFYFLKSIIILAVAALAFLGASFLGSRPQKLEAYETINPKLTKNEVMICNNADLDSRASESLYHYFAQTAHNPNNIIGATTATLRVLPLTNQNWFVAKKLQDYSTVYGKILKLGKGHHLSDAPDDVLLLEAEYDKGVDYTNYHQNYIDNIALCALGFPPIQYEKTLTDRSIIYCGSNTLTGGASPPLYTLKSLTDLATSNHIKINILDGCINPPQSGATKLQTLAKSTGGAYITSTVYNPAIPHSASVSQVTNKLDQLYHNISTPLDPSKYATQHVISTRIVDNSNKYIILLTIFATLICCAGVWIRP